jgi:hypothetical protein
MKRIQVCAALLAIAAAAVVTAGIASAGQSTAPPVSPTCSGGNCGPTAAAARAKHKRTVRFGRIVDTDNLAGDNQFHPASGKAFCKRGERVVTGGKQIISTAQLFGGPAKISDGESAPITKRPVGWSVAFGSDLGGVARQDFRVVVVCER